MTSNKSHEIGVYVDDIPMRLSDRCRPLDVSAFTEEQTVIPDPFDQHYKFAAELYALEVFEFRDNQKRQQLSESMSKMKIKSEQKLSDKESDLNSGNRSKGERQVVATRSGRSVNSIHLNPGEILKPLPKISDTISDRSIDPNVNIKTSRKLIKDFDSDISSPFDYVELQTLDDMQELNDVFQAFQSKSCTAKQTISENNDNNNKTNLNTGFNSEFPNSLSQPNCEPTVPSVQNMNGYNVFTPYGYQSSVGTSLAANRSHGNASANHWSATGYHNCEITHKTVDYVNSSSTEVHSSSDNQNNLRSSKSASDLPNLVDSEELATTPVRRQRSHTPPCASAKNKKVGPKQTLVLDDPYEELSANSKQLVDSIGSMGFERSRVARAVKHMDSDHKQVIDFLLQIQTLEESGYDSCEAEIALHMNSHQIENAKKFLESLRQLSEVGFDKRNIIKALVKCNNDREKALDILLITPNDI